MRNSTAVLVLLGTEEVPVTRTVTTTDDPFSLLIYYFTGLRGRFSVFAVQKHRYLRRSQQREVFTTPLSPVKLLEFT